MIQQQHNRALARFDRRLSALRETKGKNQVVEVAVVVALELEARRAGIRPLATLNEEGHLQIEARLANGRGYRSAEKNLEEKLRNWESSAKSRLELI